MLHPFPTASLNRKLRYARLRYLQGEPCSPHSSPPLLLSIIRSHAPHLRRCSCRDPPAERGPSLRLTSPGGTVRIIPILCHAHPERGRNRGTRAHRHKMEPNYATLPQSIEGHLYQLPIQGYPTGRITARGPNNAFSLPCPFT